MRALWLQNSAFLELDELFYKAVQGENPPHCSGSTVLAALLQGSKLHVANAGDSRAVLSKRGHAEPLSNDHRPGLESEHDRVLQSGNAEVKIHKPSHCSVEYPQRAQRHLMIKLRCPGA